MTHPIYLVSKTGQNKKPISSTLMAELINRYGVVGVTYNKGQILYLQSKDCKRIHSILVSSEYTCTDYTVCPVPHDYHPRCKTCNNS